MSQTATAPGSIVQRDHAQWAAKLKPNTPELLAYAARHGKRNAIGVGLEALRLKKRQHILLDEYVKFGLYDKARFTAEQRAEFVGFRIQSQVIRECNDIRWFAVTEDKWLSSRVLAEDGLPQPETVAVVDTSTRRYAAGTALRTPDDLRAFLTGGVEMPLFGKHNRGLMSVGVFVIENADDEMVYLRDHGGMTYFKFFEHIIGKDAFLLQKLVENHAFIRRFTTTAATIRMVNFLTDDGLWVPSAVLKLPSSKNLADNFWRKGNLLADIDPKTGTVLRLVGQDGPALRALDAHPDVDAPLVGEVLPFWDKVLEVNEKVTELHTPLKYQSTDICITDDGPVVIEVNAGSSFSLPQYASGKGFLTKRVRDTFHGWGVTCI